MPDVVHIVTEGPLGLTAMQAAKAKAIPVSSGFHSPFQDFSRFFDWLFSQADSKIPVLVSQ